MKRRKFLKTNGTLAATALFAPASLSLGSSPTRYRNNLPKTSINFYRDGYIFTQLEYASLLSKLAEEMQYEPDYYLTGDLFTDFEKYIAEITGKEAAIYLPTGTMANNIAIKLLAKKHNRVLVHKDSHIFRDEGDAASIIHNLQLLPSSAIETPFSLKEVMDIEKSNQDNYIATHLGCISYEIPLRRANESLPDFTEMERITEFARSKGIGIHMDGARLFVAAVAMGKEIKQITSLSDTIYISLYKNFNATAGAVLAGDFDTISKARSLRKILGGNTWNGWHNVLVAWHFMTDFTTRFAITLNQGKQLLNQLSGMKWFRVNYRNFDSNVFELECTDLNLDKFRAEMAKRDILLPEPYYKPGRFYIKINESLSLADNNYYIENFSQAAKKCAL